MRYHGNNPAIQRLALVWAEALPPTKYLPFSHYPDTLSLLHGATGNIGRTTYILQAVLDQAIELGRSARWVNTKLRFETHAQAVDNRPLLMGLEVKLQGAEDEALDLYNERLNRFK